MTPPAAPICDFCHAPDPRWAVELPKDLLMVLRLENPEQEWIDDGTWLACETCKEMISMHWVPGLCTRGLLNPSIRQAIRSHQITLEDAALRVVRFVMVFFKFFDRGGKIVPYVHTT